VANEADLATLHKMEAHGFITSSSRILCAGQWHLWSIKTRTLKPI